MLFHHTFKNLAPVPNSYVGPDVTCMDKDKTGISGIVPQLSGAFIRARMIDFDVHPKEFLEILKRSGSISLTQRDDGVVYGGVVPNFEQLEKNIQKWKEDRSDNTSYVNMSDDQRKERANQFKKCLDSLDKQTITISYFGKKKLSSTYGNKNQSSEIELKRTEKTTYGEYLGRADIMINSQMKENTKNRIMKNKKQYFQHKIIGKIKKQLNSAR